jgi:CheY-specific phosphatase CheX
MTQSGGEESQPFSVVQQHLVKATIDLFTDYSVPFEHVSREPAFVPREDQELVVMAVLGFAGETMRGAVVLLASRGDVPRWQPDFLGNDASLDAIHDTVGEFANMLVGRLKGSLLELGVSFLLAIPTTASGTGIRIPTPHGGTSSAWHRFEGAGGRIDVRLDVALDPAFAFRRRPSKTPPASAGDMMMF